MPRGAALGRLRFPAVPSVHLAGAEALSGCRVSALRPDVWTFDAAEDEGLADAWAPFGAALKEHWRRVHRPARQDVAPSGRTDPLLLQSSLHLRRPERIPASIFFREPAEMPPLERHALELCRRSGGRVLDIGAGAGCHALALQGYGMEVEAVDSCPDAVKVMRRRGLDAQLGCMWDLGDLQEYSTLLLLMNSAGAAGSLRGLRRLLRRLRARSAPHCRVLLDTSLPCWPDVYAAAERRLRPLAADSFADQEWAVLQCRLSHGSLVGKAFPLLFSEASSIAVAAQAAGWQSEVLFEDAQRQQALLQLTRDHSREVA